VYFPSERQNKLLVHGIVGLFIFIVGCFLAGCAPRLLNRPDPGDDSRQHHHTKMADNVLATFKPRQMAAFYCKRCLACQRLLLL
jgi:hypothetical protein